MEIKEFRPTFSNQEQIQPLPKPEQRPQLPAARIKGPLHREKQQAQIIKDRAEIKRLREELNNFQGESTEIIDIPDTLDKETPPLEVIKSKEAIYRQEYDDLTGDNGELVKLSTALAEVKRQMRLAQAEAPKVVKEEQESKGWFGWLLNLFSRSKKQPDKDSPVSTQSSDESTMKSLKVEHKNLIIKQELYRLRAQQLEGYFKLIDAA